MARLTDILVDEVSLVDKAANKRTFMIVKRDGADDEAAKKAAEEARIAAEKAEADKKAAEAKAAADKAEADRKAAEAAAAAAKADELDAEDIEAIGSLLKVVDDLTAVVNAGANSQS